MSQLKAWLCEKYLPTWCREELLEKNAALERALTEERRKTERLNAYIDGMEAALRHCGRVTIRTGEAVR